MPESCARKKTAPPRQKHAASATDTRRGKSNPCLLWFTALIASAAFLGLSKHTHEKASSSKTGTKLATQPHTPRPWEHWESDVCPKKGGGSVWGGEHDDAEMCWGELGVCLLEDETHERLASIMGDAHVYKAAWGVPLHSVHELNPPASPVAREFEAGVKRFALVGVGASLPACNAWPAEEDAVFESTYRVFARPRFDRVNVDGVGPSATHKSGRGNLAHGFLATADPMVVLGNQVWGFELFLPEAIEYTVVVIGGVGNCPVLNDLNEEMYDAVTSYKGRSAYKGKKKLKPGEVDLAQHVLDNCTMATGVEPGYEPPRLAQFYVTGAMRAPLPYVRTIPRTDHGNSKQPCDFSKLPGAWNSAGSWVSPGCSFPTVAKREYLRSTPWSWYTAAKTFGIMTFGPQRSRPYQGDSYEDSEDPGHHPAKSMRRTRRRRSKDNNNNKHSNDAFCIIGDSNTRAMVPAMKTLLAAETSNKATWSTAADVGKWKQFESRSNFLNTEINSTGDQKLFGRIASCLQSSKAVAFTFGSHAPGRSADELRESVKKVFELVDANRAAAAAAVGGPVAREPCVLVMAAPDCKYEATPKKFPAEQRFARSTDRWFAINNAVRNAVVAKNDPSVHFVDLYRPSAALHWDGHIKGDPIHFYAYMRYYEQAAEIMMAALHHHCPHA